MAEPREPVPQLLVVAAFSRHPQVLAWAQQQLEAAFGPVAKVSAAFAFTQTEYYAASMGTDLLKQFLVFEQLVDPVELASIKLRTNALEKAVLPGAFPEERPLNLDPGLLALGKFQLATTKDQAHRIYLRDGIFAEVTLQFRAGAFEPWPWTYADYREETVRAFLKEARDFYRQKLQETRIRMTDG